MAFNNFGNRFQRTTPVVLNLIIINALVFFAQSALGGSSSPINLNDLFALHHYKSEVFKPHQLVTHMFMHADFFHLLFNMFALWMFGSHIERVWGPKRFITFYLICGLGAALAQMGSYTFDFWQIDNAKISAEMADQYQVVLRRAYTLGASGAVMGVLAAYGYLFPNTELILFPIPIPVKAKWAITGIIALDVFGGISRVPNDNVAHWAHVGGALIGLLLVIYWNKTNKETFY